MVVVCQSKLSINNNTRLGVLAQGSMDADGIIIITNAVVIQSDKYPKPNGLLQLCMRRRVQEVNEVE